MTRIQADNSQAIKAIEQLDTQPKKITSIPVCSAYNSLVTDPLPTTRVGTPPLVAAPAHEWSTLLPVLMQAQDISVKVVGPTRKTVILLDLGLCQPAKKLQMARRDLKHLILRPGELHIVMAAFIHADQESITALADLGTTVQPNGNTYAGIEKLVCKLYQANTHITKIKELKWLLFRKKQAESQRLPPTLAALKEAIKRAHHQRMVWNNDIVSNPELPSPSNYGWKLE